MSVRMRGQHTQLNGRYYISYNFGRDQSSIQVSLRDPLGRETPAWYRSLWGRDETMVFYVFERDDAAPPADPDDNQKPRWYILNRTPERRVEMARGAQVGLYVCSYPSLPDGQWWAFALPAGSPVLEPIR